MPKYKKFYQPKQQFHNTLNWEDFSKLSSWDDVITHFKKRIEDFFFKPITLLYKDLDSGNYKDAHTFPISNICWALLDLFTQLKEGQSVKGPKVDNFLSTYSSYFNDVKAAKKLAKSYGVTLYDIFRNKPFHNAMVKGLGSLSFEHPDVFSIEEKDVIINGTVTRKDIIIENPINLFKGIEDYFDNYLSRLRLIKNIDFRKNFKKRIEELFEFNLIII